MKEYFEENVESSTRRHGLCGKVLVQFVGAVLAIMLSVAGACSLSIVAKDVTDRNRIHILNEHVMNDDESNLDAPIGRPKEEQLVTDRELLEAMIIMDAL
jgi:hypothetical protein